jgi:hypothetical protein
MPEAEVYVVRVYRRDANGVSGMVEDVLQHTATAFRTPEDLLLLILKQPPAQHAGDDPEAGNF